MSAISCTFITGPNPDMKEACRITIKLFTIYTIYTKGLKFHMTEKLVFYFLSSYKSTANRGHLTNHGHEQRHKN